MELRDLRTVLLSCIRSPAEAHSRLEEWMRSKPGTLIGLVPEALASLECQRTAEFITKFLAESGLNLATISDPHGMLLEPAIGIASVRMNANAGSKIRLAQHALSNAKDEHDNGRQRRIRTIGIFRRTLRSSRLMPGPRFIDPLIKLAVTSPLSCVPAPSIPCA